MSDQGDDAASAVDPAPDPSLLAAARAAMVHAYAPYSRFAVGAALRLADGTIITGANVENASYGLSLCAETVALAKAANAGRLAEVVAVAVTGGSMETIASGDGSGASSPVTPCGRCRQFLNEAAQLGGRDIAVHCHGAIGDTGSHHRLSALLPHAFGPADLGLGAKGAASTTPDSAKDR